MTHLYGSRPTKIPPGSSLAARNPHSPLRHPADCLTTLHLHLTLNSTYRCCSSAPLCSLPLLSLIRPRYPIQAPATAENLVLYWNPHLGSLVDSIVRADSPSLHCEDHFEEPCSSRSSPAWGPDFLPLPLLYLQCDYPVLVHLPLQESLGFPQRFEFAKDLIGRPAAPSVACRECGNYPRPAQQHRIHPQLLPPTPKA